MYRWSDVVGVGQTYFSSVVPQSDSRCEDTDLMRGRAFNAGREDSLADEEPGAG